MQTLLAENRLDLREACFLDARVVPVSHVEAYCKLSESPSLRLIRPDSQVPLSLGEVILLGQNLHRIVECAVS